MPPTATTRPDVVEGLVVTRNLPVLNDQSLRAEVDIQITTAKAFPRIVKDCIDEAITMATLTEEIAASCAYHLERKQQGGGKAYIKGPSVRLAEIMLMAWGNARAEARACDPDAKFANAEGAMWDLEKNTAIRVSVKRRITDRDGKRYGDDMIGTTTAAAASIALRNAIIRIIPRTVVHMVYDAALQCARGDIKTVGERRAKALAWFGSLGVTPEQVCTFLERGSVEEITIDDLGALNAAKESLKREEKTIEELFPDPAKVAAEQAAAAANGQKGAAGIASEVRKQAGTDAPATPEQEARRKQALALSEAEKVRKEKGCSPELVGCAQDADAYSAGEGGRRVCVNHAPKSEGASLPGMDAPTAGSGRKRKS